MGWLSFLHRFVSVINHLWSGSARESDHGGNTALHLACDEGNLAMVKLLIDCYPRLCLMKNKDKRIPLHIAVLRGRDDLVRELLSACPESALESGHGGNTALHLACVEGNLAMVKLLIDCYPQLCLMKNKDKRIPLHIAVMGGRDDLVRELLRACPESALESDHGGNTALHLACVQGSLDVVILLTECHPQLCLIKNKDKRIPLHIVVMGGRVDLVRELLSSCSDSIEELTSEEQTVFHLAAQCSLPNVFKVLWEEAKNLDKDYLLDRRDCKGNSLFHYAVLKNQLQIVKTCLQDQRWTTGHGFAIRVNTKNNEGYTAMDLNDKIPNPDSKTRQIGYILDHFSQREPDFSQTRASETNKEHLVVLAIFNGLPFAVIFALPDSFPKEDWVATAQVFELKDALYGELPLIFYLMFFITVLFTTSTVFLIGLLFKLHCRILMLLGGISTISVYLLLTHHIMPKFLVIAGSLLVPSYYFMWVLVLVFIFNGALIIHLGNYLMLLLSKVASTSPWPPSN